MIYSSGGGDYPFSGPLLKMLDLSGCHQKSAFVPLAFQSLAQSLYQRLPEMSDFQQSVSRDLVNFFVIAVRPANSPPPAEHRLC